MSLRAFCRFDYEDFMKIKKPPHLRWSGFLVPRRGFEPRKCHCSAVTLRFFRFAQCGVRGSTKACIKKQKSAPPNGGADSWCLVGDSNPGHPAYKAGALPTELTKHLYKGVSLVLHWQGWLDSNQRMRESKSLALPLGDTPMWIKKNQGLGSMPNP